MVLKHMFRMTTLMVVMSILLSLAVAGCSSSSRDVYKSGGDETKTLTYNYSFPAPKEIVAGITNIAYVGLDKDGQILFDGTAEGAEDFFYTVSSEDVAAGGFSVELKKVPQQTVATIAHFLQVEGAETTLLGMGCDDVSESTEIDGSFVPASDIILTIDGVATTAEIGDKVADLFAAEGVNVTLTVGETNLLIPSALLDLTVDPAEAVGKDGSFVQSGKFAITADYCGIAATPITVTVGPVTAKVCIAYTDGAYSAVDETVIYHGESFSDIPKFQGLVVCTVDFNESGVREFTPIENVEIDTNSLRLDGTLFSLDDTLTAGVNGRTLTFNYVTGKELPAVYVLEECKLKVEEGNDTFICVTEGEDLVLVDNHTFSVNDILDVKKLTLVYKDDWDNYVAVPGAVINKFRINTGSWETTRTLSLADNEKSLEVDYDYLRGYALHSRMATLTVVTGP